MKIKITGKQCAEVNIALFTNLGLQMAEKKKQEFEWHIFK